jgi:membrane protein implicated in regulation of membrane protease activity
VDAWVLWLIAAVVLGLIEVTTLTLVVGFFAGGAIAAAIADLLGAGIPVQVAVFIVVSVASLGLIRPVIRSHLRPGIGARTGVAALVGRSAIVTERVDAHHGQIKLAGEIWTARPYDPSLIIEPGSSVDVMEIQGATAMVYPTEASWTRTTSD